MPGAPVNDTDECEEFYPETITPARHHDILLDKLQDVAEGRIKRLMILMPPGSAKSTYASVVFPTWFMGAYGHKNIIMTTYGSDLAKKFGRKCRQIVRSTEYQQIFGCTLTGDNAAVDDWSITNGSTYMCGGILSGITGNRADGLIIDDPFKGREDADSETIRAKTLDEYKSSLKTRLKPGGWEIVINTRWHELDLSGSILPEDYAGESGWIIAQDGALWYVLCMQAQCERDDDPLGRKIGEYLWTEWFTPEWWEQTKRTQSIPTPRNWSALYQQRPSPEEGNYFRKEWLRWYTDAPDIRTLKVYGSSDYAVTQDGGDWTVHQVWGVDPQDNLYLLDMWRGQTDSLVWVEQLIDYIKRYRPLEWVEESGQIIKSVGPLIDKLQRERQAYCYRRQLTSSSDKPTRAQALRGRMAQGKVYLPRNAEYIDILERELLTFPTGRNDDIVDAAGLIGRLLSDLIHGSDLPIPRPPIQAKPITVNELLQKAKAKRLREYD